MTGWGPTSEGEHRAYLERRLPEPELLAPGLWCVPVPMPRSTPAYTLSLVQEVAGGALAVVDPGWQTDAALERWESFLASIGRRVSDIRWIVGTHGHADHVGLAEHLRSESGAPLIMSAREQPLLRLGGQAPLRERDARLAVWEVPETERQALMARLDAVEADRSVPPTADVLLDEDGPLPIDGSSWRMLSTPGHTPGHIAVVDDEHRLVVTGDHLLPMMYPGVGLGIRLETNPLADYLSSLERLRPFDDWQAIPSHGYRFGPIGPRRRATREHVLERAREVAAIEHSAPGLSVWELASRITWGGGWERVTTRMVLYSALAQTAMYRQLLWDPRWAGALRSSDGDTAVDRQDDSGDEG